MCLITKEIMPSTSAHDIHCYKILIPVGSELITPYRDFPFHIGEVVLDVAEEVHRFVWEYNIIEGGYFHSYTDLEFAKKIIRQLKSRFPKGTIFKVYNAIIPQGVCYYKGDAGDICSKALKIINECCD